MQLQSQHWRLLTSEPLGLDRGDGHGLGFE
jgi:hypothetical protein